ncbi:hypothetical protein [Nostoc sp.]|uniref:hypothetical protein n=1 Tax=Nostoc sp. TaxID=1180 RepID=UPI002FF67DCD
MSRKNLQFLSLRYGQFAQVGKPAHATALLCAAVASPVGDAQGTSRETRPTHCLASAVNLFLQMI